MKGTRQSNPFGGTGALKKRAALLSVPARNTALFAGLLLLLLSVVSCTGVTSESAAAQQVVMVNGEEIVVTRDLRNTPRPPATMTPSATEQEIAVLDIALASMPETLDPQQVNNDIQIDLIENLFVGLTRYNGATGVVEPDLATDWEVSDDGLVWTFNLRDDIYWIRPGLPDPTRILPAQTEPQPYRTVIADDVVFAVQRACDSRTQARDVLALYVIEGCEAVHAQVEATEEDLAGIGVRAVDEYTVEFTLTKPASYFSTITSLTLLRPVPREVVAAYEETGASWAEFPAVLTNGRFLVTTDDTTQDVDDSRTALQRNPYWPTSFSGTVELVNIYWTDSEAAYELWLNKSIDVSPVPVGMREEIMQDTRLQSRTQLVPTQALFFLAYNFDSELFSDPSVRRAFSAAIDRQALIETVYGGAGLPVRHLSPPGVLGAPPSDQVGVGYSPDWARLQMAESQVRDCSFIPEINYLVSNTDLALFHAETLRTMWSRELGCPEEKIVIEQAQFGSVLARTQAGASAERPDLWDLGWTSYYPDAHNWLGEILHCEESENRQNRPCTEADNLISQAATASSLEERRSLYRQAEELFFGDNGVQPVAPLFVQGSFELVQPWLVHEPAHFGGEQYDRYFIDPLTKRLERQQ